MGKIAFVFAGQGAQYEGMGKELYESSAVVKELFNTAEAMRPQTMDQCFYGDKETLSKTINTQPCMFLVDLGAALALKESGIQPCCVAGFSLGEISAITFANILTIEEGFSLVCNRGKYMEDCAKNTDGGMVAVLKLDNDTVKSLCEQFSNVYPVNFNCNGQVVVAGDKTQLQEFVDSVSKNKGRAIPLAVNGAFHSPFMQEASENMTEYLKGVNIKKGELPVYANITALPYDKESTKELIAKQISSPVLWWNTIENMINDGVDTFIEVGPGKTICGLIKKIDPSVKTFNVCDKASLDVTINAINSKGEQ